MYFKYKLNALTQEAQNNQLQSFLLSASLADLHDGAVVFESLGDFNQVSVTPNASAH